MLSASISSFTRLAGRRGGGLPSARLGHRGRYLGADRAHHPAGAEGRLHRHRDHRARSRRPVLPTPVNDRAARTRASQAASSATSLSGIQSSNPWRHVRLSGRISPWSQCSLDRLGRQRAGLLRRWPRTTRGRAVAASSPATLPSASAASRALRRRCPSPGCHPSAARAVACRAARRARSEGCADLLVVNVAEDGVLRCGRLGRGVGAGASSSRERGDARPRPPGARTDDDVAALLAAHLSPFAPTLSSLIMYWARQLSQTKRIGRDGPYQRARAPGGQGTPRAQAFPRRDWTLVPTAIGGRDEIFRHGKRHQLTDSPSPCTRKLRRRFHPDQLLHHFYVSRGEQRTADPVSSALRGSP